METLDNPQEYVAWRLRELLADKSRRFIVAGGEFIVVQCDILDFLAEHLERVPVSASPARHRCYRCNKWTTLGTAWCQKCLDEAEEHKRRYPPRKKPIHPREPLPHPRWSEPQG